MKQSWLSQELVLIVFWLILAVLWVCFSYPLVIILTHGFKYSLWPISAIQVDTWLFWLANFQFDKIFEQYRLMYEGTNPGLPWGGMPYLWAIGSTLCLAVVASFPKSPRKDDHRDAGGLLGSARWATISERARMTHGLEIGHDPETGKVIKLRTESNLLSIAPPRSGKTSGLIINSLLVPDKNSWSGPCVVIDPKGEVFEAVVRRRRELGRRVIKFDLRKGAKNVHRWNPMSEMDLQDVAHFQRITKALVSDAGSGNQYFTDRGGDIFTGMLLVAMVEAAREKRVATPADVARLLGNPDIALGIAETSKLLVLELFAADMRMDEKARDQLISTAKTGVKWLMDERFQKITAKSSFTMAEVARGQVDLFIMVPPGDADLLAPLLRWMFAEFFAAMETERKRGDERIVMFVDEANKLGTFIELVNALSLLPGLGVSIWSFWQSRAQIVKYYGESGADVFFDTAEIVTISDLSQLTDEAESVSKALGEYTALLPSTNANTSKDGTSSGESKSLQAVRLMTASELTAMEQSLIVFLKSDRYARRPLNLKKVRYFEEARFEGLHDSVAPVGAL